MEVVSIERSTYEELLTSFNSFVTKMKEMASRGNDKGLGDWLDNQDDIVRVIWKGFWKVAIIRLISDRGKKEPLVVRVLREYNTERRMTDFANHSSFCFEDFVRQ